MATTARPECQHRPSCSKTAVSVMRTKQVRNVPGAGIETTITWDITDAGEFLRKTGVVLCAEHRDMALRKLGEIL